MFTGIVQQIAQVAEIRRSGAAAVVALDLAERTADVSVGDSVMVDGVCLTAGAVNGSRAEFDVSSETLRLTTLGELRRGSAVNVEAAMRPTDRFGGHFVSGHVDGTGTILQKAPRPGEVRLRVGVTPQLAAQMVMKGSVAVDGISLTVAALEDTAFEVSIIPHTLEATTLKDKNAGTRVNIECNMIGKWVRRLLGDAAERPGALTMDKLKELGF